MATYSKSKKTRQALIVAAGELVAEYGLGQVSTRAIAERSGENLGSIHYHFGSKTQLLKEMIRFVNQDRIEKPLSRLLRKHENLFKTFEGQAEIIRMIVHYEINHILSSDRPAWYAQAMYQVFEHPGPLQDFVFEIMVDPLRAAIHQTIKRIRPDLDAIEASLWHHMIVGTLVFHAIYVQALNRHLGTETYSEDYLAKLEERIANDGLRALGLPTDISIREYERIS